MGVEVRGWKRAPVLAKLVDITDPTTKGPMALISVAEDVPDVSLVKTLLKMFNSYFSRAPWQNVAAPISRRAC